MAKIIGLPKLSPTMDEGTLVAWAKREGEKIEIDDLLAEVETDKATMEFRSFDRGTLLKILAPAGTTLGPDAPVAIIGNAGEDISELLAKIGKSGDAASSEAKADSKAEAKSGAKSGKDDKPAKEEKTSKDAKSAKEAKPAKSEPADEGDDDEGDEDESDDEGEPEGARNPPRRSDDERVLASPLVRRLAREKDVDLREIAGTGPHGRIVKKDLEAALASGPKKTKSAPAAPSAARGEPRVEKVSQMRKTIARRLTESKRDIPHYYLTIDIDAEPLMAARQAINALLEASGEKISPNDLLIKACAVALRRYPKVNASFGGDTITYHSRVDISVAVAIPDGLITPVIRDADVKGVAEIAREVKELAGRAKAKKLDPSEFTDGTFSISNLGMYGIEEFTAVINPPEGAILAVGAVRDEPVVKGNAIVPGKRLRMTMSCDHRVIDGAVGAEFLALLKKLLESPAALII
jgi:pyruvate dehydrogenase E2 component (dihydrolipoamide acetyltransferase)